MGQNSEANKILNIRAVQIKTCIILSAINTHGITKIKAIKSRDHTELMLKSFNYPIKIVRKKKYDLIDVEGMKQFKSFEYKVQVILVLRLFL